MKKKLTKTENSLAVILTKTITEFYILLVYN